MVAIRYHGTTYYITMVNTGTPCIIPCYTSVYHGIPWYNMILRGTDIINTMVNYNIRW